MPSVVVIIILLVALFIALALLNKKNKELNDLNRSNDYYEKGYRSLIKHISDKEKK